MFLCRIFSLTQRENIFEMCAYSFSVIILYLYLLGGCVKVDRTLCLFMMWLDVMLCYSSMYWNIWNKVGTLII